MIGTFSTLETLDFQVMIVALTQPQAFPFSVSTDEITLIQTHASAVVLTPSAVYKLKKPENFGFFDYSTPTLRRHFCQQEVVVNASLAPHVYLGIASILQTIDQQFRFGPTVPAPDVPLPGTRIADGTVVDYAVVMVRLPDENMLDALVQADTVEPQQLTEVAQKIAAFHTNVSTSQYIASFGRLEVIRANWEENFRQMKPYVGRTLEAATYERIVTYVHQFLHTHAELFLSRIHGRWIRDGHGDLRLEHVYLLDKAKDQAYDLPHLVILDRIEFNERFRYGDVASEVAFLAMELEAVGRPDLARSFVDAYVTATGDKTLRELLPFYLCYRACVRGKVLSFQLDEPEVACEQQEHARVKAASFFDLAARYAQQPTSPTVVMVGGLMGTGKSTLARALQQELGWPLFSSDITRKWLVQSDPAQSHADGFGQGIYSPLWTARTYQALCREAGKALAQGHSVLLDATFLRRDDREAVIREARNQNATVQFVECMCPRSIALERLAERWGRHLSRSSSLQQEASLASDGRPDLYDAQCASWEALSGDEEARMKHLKVVTTAPLPACVERVLDALSFPRQACWLAKR